MRPEVGFAMQTECLSVVQEVVKKVLTAILKIYIFKTAYEP